MLVYLDTAIIRNAMQERYPADLLETLHSHPDVTLVVSPTHGDDTVAASPETDEQFRGVLTALPAKWAVPGHVVPSVELGALLDQLLMGDDWTAPVVVFDNDEELVEAYPEFFDVVDLRGERAPFEEQRQARARQKEHIAAGVGYAKRAADPAQPGKQPQVQASIARALAADNDAASAEDEAAWQAERQKALELLEDQPELAALSREAAYRSDAFWFLSEDDTQRLTSLFLEGATMTSRVHAALKRDDRAELLAIQEDAAPLQRGIFSLIDPFTCSGTKKGDAFVQFIHWVPDRHRDRIGSDLSVLQECFETWLGDVERCPAGHCVVEVGWQMKKSVATPAKPSCQTDLMHVGVLPYVDVLFADRRIHAYLNQGDLPDTLKDRCARNGNFVAWVQGLR